MDNLKHTEERNKLSNNVSEWE